MNIQEFPEIPRPDLLIHPLLNTPEPKSRFVPSRWEAKKIAYLAKAIRKGWIKVNEEEDEKPQYHLMWDGDQSTEMSKRLKMHIPPPPTVLPSMWIIHIHFDHFVWILILCCRT